MNLFGMIFLSWFLKATGNPNSNIVLILSVWVFVIMVWLFLKFFQRRSYFHKLLTVLDNLDKRYLIGEVMEVKHHLEDQLYREVILKSNKAVIEKINQIEKEQNDYREYIETWIHEVKQPLTAMLLMCENHKNEMTRNFRLELKKLENYVDLALFYARSDDVYQDYIIKQVDLEQIAIQMVQKDKAFFIEHQFSVDLDIMEKIVYTDEKWLQFILRQILLNAVKYRKGDSGKIQIYSQAKKCQAAGSASAAQMGEYPAFSQNAVCLVIEDHGIGIPAHELGRIFEKGFTGSNGRRDVTSLSKPVMHQESTGIGLYLCKKLCGKMDIGMEAESNEGEFTRIILVFPVGVFGVF